MDEDVEDRGDCKYVSGDCSKCGKQLGCSVSCGGKAKCETSKTSKLMQKCPKTSRCNDSKRK